MRFDNYKIYWNKEKNIPIVIEESRDTLRIKNENLEYVTMDLRPVFLEEKHLIKNLFGLTESIYYKTVWCTKQGRYIVDGKFLKQSAVQSIKNIENLDVFREKVLNFIKSSEMVECEEKIFKNFIEENKEHLYYLLESRDLDSEGHCIGAYPFIEDVMKKYSKRIPMVSFSGGKDSTVVSHMVRKATNNPSILHIFGDTTLELPLTYKYVEEFKKMHPTTPFFDEKNEENDFFEMCKEIGPPSRVMAWCCSIFKTGPMGTTLSNFEEDFLTFYGVRRKESQSRSKYPRILKSTKINKQLSIGPIIDWLDVDVWLYILSEKISFNHSYRLGDSRVGCWVCPHKGNWSDFTAKIYNGNSHKKWEDFLLSFAKSIGKEDYEDYVKTDKWKIRRGGEGLEKTRNSSLVKKECIDEKNTHIISLSRDVTEEFMTLFKPFGDLIFRNIGDYNEVFIINKKSEVLFKIVYKYLEKEIRLSIIDMKDRYLFSKITKQFNKFNNCIYCQACNSTCSFGALSVVNGKYNIDEKKCVQCKNCIDKFSVGCLVAAALSTKSKEQ